MKFGIYVLLGMLALLTFGCLGKWGVSSETTTICVKNKFIDPPSYDGESSHYVVISTTGDAYEVDRSYFNVLDKEANPDIIYASIESNRSYEIVTTGARIDVLYNYPLIQRITDKGNC